MTATVGEVAVPFLDLGAMQRDLQGELDSVWRRVTDQGAFIGGPDVEDFEREWAAYCGAAHAVGTGNGTDALELVLRGLGVGPGDEVVVPGNTFVATASAVVAVGAVPRFVDVDPATLLVTPDAVLAAAGPRTAAVIAVHLFGQPAGMAGLLEVARRLHVPLIEDAAQAHGATWQGRRVGSFGDAACFSFYPGKNLGAFGDAGAVVTDDPRLAERIRSLANHGRPAASKHDHVVAGRNSRLDGLQAAVLSAKLPWLDRWNAGRRAAHALYLDRLAGSRASLVQQDPSAQSVFHLEVARAPDRDRLRSALSHRGIATGIHYPLPCHELEAFAHLPRTELPAVEAAAREIVSLPIFPHMTAVQVDAVAAAVREAVPA